MFAGRVFGEVLTVGTLPVLILREAPSVDAAPLGEGSRGAYGGNGALENCGEVLARRAACGATGGARGFGAGPCGGDLADTALLNTDEDTIGAVGGGAVVAGGMVD